MKTRTIMSVVAILMCIAVVAGQQPAQVLGKTNLHGWIDDSPALPGSIDEAIARKNSNIYQTFYEKVEAFKKAYRQSVSSGVRPDETAMRKAAEAQANSIPAIARMGGIEKLAQMTPEQRAQAAQQMKQLMLQNPALSLSSGLGITNSAGDMAVQQYLQQMVQQRGSLETEFRTMDGEITNSPGSHREINEVAVAKLAKIPMVNDSVMGRVHDLEQEAALNKETAALHRERAIRELEQRTALLASQKLKLKDFASSYQNWLKQNVDNLRGLTTVIGVAQYEESFIDAAQDLARYSEAVSKDLATYQEMSQMGTGAIRKRK